MDDSTSIWKKEISFRRKPKLAAAAPEPVVVPEPPVAEEILATPGEAVDLVHAAETAPATPAEPVGAWVVPDAAPTPDVSDAAQAEAAEDWPDASLAELALPEPVSVEQPTGDETVAPQSDLVPASLASEHVAPADLPSAGETTTVVEIPTPEQSKARRFRAGSRLRRPKAPKLGSAKTSKPKRSGLRSHRPKKIVGLKIGASQLAAAHVSNNGHASLLQVARESLESGVVVGGELRDPDALAVALKAFFRKHKLPRRGVRLGISNNRIGVRLFDISGIMDPDQLKNAVRFRAQETLPIPLDQAVLDYHVVAESIDEDGTPRHRILLVVAYRDLVERYALACRKAGIKLMGVDLEAFALLRALGEPQASEGAERTGVVVVSVGHERSTFAVSDGAVCEFTRVLDWGGFSLNVAIARALDLTPSEAERIKQSLSLEVRETPEGMEDEAAELARTAIERELESFARDLVSSLRFYQNQPDSLAIAELVLTGGTAGLPGLAEGLERLIGVRVRVGDPLGRVHAAKRVGTPEQLGSLAAAIGLGIED